jgi:hypothetical protein
LLRRLDGDGAQALEVMMGWMTEAPSSVAFSTTRSVFWRLSSAKHSQQSGSGSGARVRARISSVTALRVTETASARHSPDTPSKTRIVSPAASRMTLAR